jgi:hypothetical protein
MLLTIDEAIKQGYKLAGRANEDEQCLVDLSKLTKEDFEEYEWAVAEKEGSSPHIDADGIIEMISESLYGLEEWYDESDKIGQKVATAVDWDEITKKINDSLSELKYYKLTKIGLVYDSLSYADKLSDL